ncbi:MAG: TerB family tellurite resistance protein [Gammaproteobacteria bacterium]|jgi:uncharacterized tellurite resistance protein B-like protein
MLEAIREFLESRLLDNGPGSVGETRADPLQLATATLLVEMARADHSYSQEESATLGRVLAEHFSLNEETREALVALAEDKSRKAVSLHEFTRLLHENLAPREKLEVIEMLWRVAYADARLDKYEDHLMHKIADLLYVPLVDLMRIKDRVKREVRAGRH